MILKYIIYGLKTNLLYYKIYNHPRYSKLFYFNKLYPLWAWYACQITVATSVIYAFLLYKWYMLSTTYIVLLCAVSLISILAYFFVVGFWALSPIKLEQENIYIKLMLAFSNDNDEVYVETYTYYGFATLLKRLEKNPTSKYPELHKEIKKLTTTSHTKD